MTAGFFNYLACALGVGTPPAFLSASDLERQQRLLQALQRNTRVSLRFTHFLAELPRLRTVPRLPSSNHFYSSPACKPAAFTAGQDAFESPGGTRRSITAERGKPTQVVEGDLSPCATVWEAGLADLWRSAGVDSDTSLSHPGAAETNVGAVQGFARHGVDGYRLASSREAGSGGEEGNVVAGSGSEEVNDEAESGGEEGTDLNLSLHPSFVADNKDGASLIFLLSCASPDPYSSLHFCRFLPFLPLLAYRSMTSTGSGVTCFSGVFDEWRGPVGVSDSISDIHTLRLTTDPELLRQLHQMQTALMLERQQDDLWKRLTVLQSCSLPTVKLLSGPNTDAARLVSAQGSGEKAVDAESVDGVVGADSAFDVHHFPCGTDKQDGEDNPLRKRHSELQILLRNLRLVCLAGVSHLFSPPTPKYSCLGDAGLHSFGDAWDTPPSTHAGALRHSLIRMSLEGQAHQQPLPLTARLVGLACLLEQALEASGNSLGGARSGERRHDKRLMDEVFTPPRETQHNGDRGGLHSAAVPALPHHRQTCQPCCPRAPSGGVRFSDSSLGRRGGFDQAEGSIRRLTAQAEVPQQAPLQQLDRLTGVGVAACSPRNVLATPKANTNRTDGVSTVTSLAGGSSDKRSRSDPRRCSLSPRGKACFLASENSGARDAPLGKAALDRSPGSRGEATEVGGTMSGELQSNMGRLPYLDCLGVPSSPPSAWAIRTPFCGKFETPAAAASALVGEMDGLLRSPRHLGGGSAGRDDGRMLQAVQELLQPPQKDQHKQHLLVQGRKVAIINALTSMQMKARCGEGGEATSSGAGVDACRPFAREHSDGGEGLAVPGRMRTGHRLCAAITAGSAGCPYCFRPYCSSRSLPPGSPSIGETALAFSLLYRGAPANSLLADLAVAIAGLPSLQHVQRFWSSFLLSLRSAWEARRLVPRIFAAAHPVPYQHARTDCYCWHAVKAGSGCDAEVGGDGSSCRCDSGSPPPETQRRGTVARSGVASGSRRQAGEGGGSPSSGAAGEVTVDTSASEPGGRRGRADRRGTESSGAKIPWWRFASSSSSGSPQSFFSANWRKKARRTSSSQSAAAARAAPGADSEATRAFLSISSAFFGPSSFDAALSSLAADPSPRISPYPLPARARCPCQQHFFTVPCSTRPDLSPEALASAAVEAGASCVPDGPVGIPDMRGCLVQQHLQQLNYAIQQLRILSWQDRGRTEHNRRGRSHTRTGRRQTAEGEGLRLEGGRHWSESKRPSDSPFQSHRFLNWAETGDREDIARVRENVKPGRALRVLLPGMPPVTEVTLGLHRAKLDQPDKQEGGRKQPFNETTGFSFVYLRACRAAYEAARAERVRELEVGEDCREGKLDGKVPTFTEWWLKNLGGPLLGLAELRRLLDRQELLLRMRQTALLEAKDAARSCSLGRAIFPTTATPEKEVAKPCVVSGHGGLVPSPSGGDPCIASEGTPQRHGGSSAGSGQDPSGSGKPMVNYAEDSRARARAVTAAVARAAARVARTEVAKNEVAEEKAGMSKLVEDLWKGELGAQVEAAQPLFFDAVVRTTCEMRNRCARLSDRSLSCCRFLASGETLNNRRDWLGMGC